jgi:hypothetical protein
MKVHEFEILVRKLQLQTRDSGDRLAWFVYEGKTITRTKRSHGRGDLPAHLIRQQLKVNEQQFSGLIDCSLSRDNYIDILRERRLIE